MEIIFHPRGAVLAEDFKGIATDKLKSLDRFSVLVEGVKVILVLVSLHILSH